MQTGQRAMLASLKISAWSARKYDRKATAEVAAKHGTAEDSGRYTKKLLGDSATYNALNAALGELRTAQAAIEANNILASMAGLYGPQEATS